MKCNVKECMLDIECYNCDLGSEIMVDNMIPVTAKYKCRLCNDTIIAPTSFVNSLDELREWNLHELIMYHNCLDENIGIAELLGYIIKEKI